MHQSHPDRHVAAIPVSKIRSTLLGGGLIKVAHRDVGALLGQPGGVGPAIPCLPPVNHEAGRGACLHSSLAISRQNLGNDGLFRRRFSFVTRADRQSAVREQREGPARHSGAGPALGLQPRKPRGWISSRAERLRLRGP
jgi:hypothetical protein